MYIYKNPKIGGEVVPHTDNTYLITNPLSTIGIWIALDDSNVNIKKNNLLKFINISYKDFKN